MVSNFQSQKPSSAFPGCQFCHGRGCILCPGERRKAEGDRAKSANDRAARLAAMTPEQILATLPKVREGVVLACGLTGQKRTDEEIDALARSQVLQNLKDGGHEFPFPDPVFTLDPSNPEQWEEFKTLFHFDRLKEAAATEGGFQALLEEAKAVMQRRKTHLLKITTSDQKEHQIQVTAQEKSHLPTLHQELRLLVEEWCQQQGIAVETLHSWDYDYL